MTRTILIILSLIVTMLSVPAEAQESVELAIGKADAVVDLRTTAGAKLLDASWRFAEAKIVERKFRAPGPSSDDALNLYPTGREITAHDLHPKAGAAMFDDSQWEILDPSSLENRRGSGLLSFCWFRINITIPELVGELETKDATAVFEIVVDDYAEIFVDGKLNKAAGQAGGSVVKGWNARNRVNLGKVRPGQSFQLAILATNGPLADLPENYIWIRSATVDFYKTSPGRDDWKDVGSIVRIDAALDQVVPADAKVERLATGFQFTEGPAWHPDGFLVFSDPNTNVIYAYKPATGNVEVFQTKSGYAGVDIGLYHQPGSNGIAFDSEGRMLVCQHGNRRVVRIEKKGPVTIVADRYAGKRLNSPNDLTVRSDGALFFTDPPYGLPQLFSDPGKEQPHSGVYAVVGNQVKLAAKDLDGPNGIAFSPDESISM
ncbi:MAG: SMP-30/gluconolactonase/LRE family protein [Bacteroidia bacterium]|nr:SMP-30/gluconolactonase/LRE family protein [Bacteroidia bacterium]